MLHDRRAHFTVELISTNSVHMHPDHPMMCQYGWDTRQLETPKPIPFSECSFEHDVLDCFSQKSYPCALKQSFFHP